MATCPLCSERPGKRYCPAKDVQICAVCCGTKREVEIDCPAPCPYLKTSRLYDMEKERRIPDPLLEARVRRLDDNFVERNHQAMDAVCIAIAEERPNAPWLVDSDVIEVYKALAATESSGSWSQAVVAPAPSNADSNPEAYFDGIDCPTAGTCTAVGSYTDSSGHTQALAAAASGGTWGPATEVTAPSNAAPDPDANLTGVSCTSAGNCEAVGEYGNDSGYTTLAIHN